MSDFEDHRSVPTFFGGQRGVPLCWWSEPLSLGVSGERPLSYLSMPSDLIGG